MGLLIFILIHYLVYFVLSTKMMKVVIVDYANDNNKKLSHKIRFWSNGISTNSSLSIIVKLKKIMPVFDINEFKK
jgi:hypothetical protein